MIKAANGFTLAELLIALALLGIIAAFTIPKVIQASGAEETQAKLKEVVSTMEQAWYNQKMQNQQGVGNTLFASILPSLNVVESNAGSVSAVNAPYNGMAPAHPCTTAGMNADQGWIQFQNGVVISGLTTTQANGMLTAMPPVGSLANSTYVLCVDTNGRNTPNVPGADIFVGNFNQWGDFDSTAGSAPAGYDPLDVSRSFHWGSANAVIYSQSGAPLGAPFNVPDTRIGRMLQ